MKPQKERISITIDPDLHKKLRKLMEKLDRSRSWLICHAIKKLTQKD